MKTALFLTTDLERARALLAEERRQDAAAQLTVFVRDEHRDVLAADLRGCEVRRDKPAGGKLAFVRALRRERFDRAVVAWHGGDRPQPLRLGALFSGARVTQAHDERGRRFAVRWYAPWTWVAHALRRLATLRATTLAQVATGTYRWTIGALVAFVLLGPTLLRCQRRRRTGPKS